MEMFKIISVLLIVLHLNLVCGIQNGTEAEKHQFPYAVLVRGLNFGCSGALISDRHVITAAHCLVLIEKGEKAMVDVAAYVRYGNTTNGKRIYSDKFWIHENFTQPLMVFDIGIIELPEPLVRSDSIQWLKLSTKLNADLDAEDKEVVLAGWGRTENFYGVANKLRYTKMNLIPLDECKKFKSHFLEDMNDDHICTSKIKGIPCAGDSGAAIVSTKTKEIIGILSYGKDAKDAIKIGYNDCKLDIPEVFTRISSYIVWISEKTEIQFPKDTDFDMSNNVTDGVISTDSVNNNDHYKISDRAGFGLLARSFFARSSASKLDAKAQRGLNALHFSIFAIHFFILQEIFLSKSF